MLTGFVTGLLVPVLAFCIYVVIFRGGERVIDVLTRFADKNVLSHVISLSVIPNLLAFLLFLWSSKELSARGVIGATLLYSFVVAGLILI